MSGLFKHYFIFILFLAGSKCYSQNVKTDTCSRDIYKYQKAGNSIYFPAKIIKDSVNGWTIIKQRGNRKDSTFIPELFSYIFDFRLTNDSLLIVIGSKTYQTTEEDTNDSTVLCVYSRLLKSNPPHDNIVWLKQLHYYSFDQNGFIAVTDTSSNGSHTYYLHGNGEASVSVTDGPSLDSQYLFPSLTKNIFISRNRRDSLFTIAQLNNGKLHAIDPGKSRVFVQNNSELLCLENGLWKYYKIDKSGSITTSRPFTTASSFKPDTKYAVAQNQDKWFVVDSSDLTDFEIVPPGSGLKIISLQVMPNTTKIIIEADSGENKTTLWYYIDIFRNNKAVKINFHGYPSKKIVALAYDYILVQKVGNDTTKIAKLDYPDPITSLGSFDIDKSVCFRNLNVGLGQNKKGFLLVAPPKSSKNNHSRAFAIQLTTGGNNASLLNTDKSIDSLYYVSQNRFFIFKDAISGFWQARDLKDIYSGNSKDLIISKDSTFRLLKPFTIIENQFGTEGITNSEACKVIYVVN